jgi:hypothetical protein
MTDVRCVLFKHRWQRQRHDDTSYYECTRGHDIRDSSSRIPPGVTLLG